MLRPLPCSFAAAALFLAVVPGCDDTRPIAPIKDGLPECLSLEDLCHAPGVKFGGRYEECHDIGHVRNGKECLKYYDECSTLCRAAGEGGEGGGGHEAGAGGEHSHEAGAGGEHSHEAGAGGGG
ncbi:MAG TPA: hypothetical protein VGK73_22855 [Polyangiaceae bacterium]